MQLDTGYVQLHVYSFDDSINIMININSKLFAVSAITGAYA